MVSDRRRSLRRDNHYRLCIYLQNGDYIRRYSTDPGKESRHNCRNLIMSHYIVEYDMIILYTKYPII